MKRANSTIDRAMYRELDRRMERAEKRYGVFASSHEALGVACEEWDELRAAIKSNDLHAIAAECLDLAAVLIRLAEDIQQQESTQLRSVK